MQRFERIREVNRGGIGCIDAAHDPVIGRRVAIKVLRPELRGEEPAEASSPRKPRSPVSSSTRTSCPSTTSARTERGPSS